MNIKRGGSLKDTELFLQMPNGMAQAQRRDRGDATTIIVPFLAGCIPSAAEPLSPGAGVGREHSDLYLA
jgi:hypothetical protein